MGTRRTAREMALQMLYQAEAASMPIAEVIERFWSDRPVTSEVRDFAERLARGTAFRAHEIDPLIQQTLDNWRLDRLAIVDRNVLRMAVFEILHEPDTPEVVVIDEAIEVAKRFGGEESGQFVNGILDAVRKGARETVAVPTTPTQGPGDPEAAS